MSDAPSTHNSGDNVPVFSVTEVSGLVKSTVEGAFSHVRIRGEISGFKRAASGHLYFTLKDDGAVIDGVCWRTTAGRLQLDPEDGMEIIATGRITTYAGRSKYQIVVERIELAGEGALLKLLKERKRKLAEEGLFADDRKRDLPYLPGVIGVVTSPTGAVIRDILHRLADRFPRRVLMWPVLVQGDGAAEQVAAAIQGFNAMDTDGAVPRPDLLIVVRAAAESDIPLVSAVGHETDWTLIDLASDRRAPTPTAAAEMAVPVRHEVMARVTDGETRLIRAMRRKTDTLKREVAALARGLPNLRRTVEAASQRLDDWSERLGNALRSGLRQRRQRLPKRLQPPTRAISEARKRIDAGARDLRRAYRDELAGRTKSVAHLGQLLESYSYERVLDRGFALVTAADGGTVTSVAALRPGDDVNIRLKDGSTGARIAGGAAQSKKKPKKPQSGGGDDPQGSLL